MPEETYFTRSTFCAFRNPLNLNAFRAEFLSAKPKPFLSSKEKIMKKLKVMLLFAVIALGMTAAASAAQAGCCASDDCCANCSGCKH